jgi:hypothetical protein
VHFYFDIQNRDGVTSDDTGLELASLDAAQREAIIALPGIMKEAGGIGKTTIRVRKQGGRRILFRASLTLSCSPGAKAAA